MGGPALLDLRSSFLCILLGWRCRLFLAYMQSFSRFARSSKNRGDGCGRFNHKSLNHKDMEKVMCIRSFRFGLYASPFCSFFLLILLKPLLPQPALLSVRGIGVACSSALCIFYSLQPSLVYYLTPLLRFFYALSYVIPSRATFAFTRYPLDYHIHHPLVLVLKRSTLHSFV